jgi:hypothetical protein
MLIEMLAAVCELSPHCQQHFGSCLQYPFCHHQQETPEVLVISYLKMWNFVKELLLAIQQVWELHQNGQNPLNSQSLPILKSRHSGVT